MPSSTESATAPRPSLREVWNSWRVRGRARRAMAQGRARRAADLLKSLPPSDDAALICEQARAMAAAGSPGAARRLLKESQKRIHDRLEAVMSEIDRAALASAGAGVVPLHLLGKLPRHVPGVTEIDGVKIRFPDGPAAFSAHQEIFARRLYEIPRQTSPRIIDGGANIGLAALFFRKRHPDARITCFEADPAVAGYLRENLNAGGADDVEVIEAALWSEDGSLTFSGEGSDAGRVGESGAGTRKQVRAARLSPYLQEPVDLLKLDIEGAELPVMRECRDALGPVRRVFVEYHSFEKEPQCLDELLAILRAAGFRVAVTVSDALASRPFVERGSSLGMDMRLNVFGFREDA